MVYLSPGQKRIREIVAEHYPIYKNYVDRGDFHDNAYDFFKALLKAFKNAPLITKDNITGQHFDDLTVSDNYLSWQVDKAGGKWDNWKRNGNTPANTKLDRFYSQMNGYFYEGHRQYHSTFFSLMGLHQGKQLTEMESVTYYPQEGVLTTGSDGHHRTLAHVLYGEPVLNTRSHYMVKTEPDPELNYCLLKIEKFFKEISKTPEFRHSEKYSIHKSRIFFRNPTHVSEGDMENVRIFCQDTSDEDWDLIRQVMLDCITNKVCGHRFIKQETVTITDLVEFSNDIRRIYGLPLHEKVCLKIKNRSPAWRQNVSQLERLLLG